MPLDPATNMFASQAFLDLKNKRQAIADAEAAVAAANAVLEQYRAEAERLEQIEAERLYGIREKEMISRRQAARNRVSTLTKIAAQFEAELEVAGITLGKFRDEVEALDAVLPDTVARPFTSKVLYDLLQVESYYNGLTPQMRQRTEPFNAAVEAIGKAAVEQMSDALGIRPSKAAAAEETTL